MAFLKPLHKYFEYVLLLWACLLDDHNVAFRQLQDVASLESVTVQKSPAMRSISLKRTKTESNLPKVGFRF